MHRLSVVHIYRRYKGMHVVQRLFVIDNPRLPGRNRLLNWLGDRALQLVLIMCFLLVLVLPPRSLPGWAEVKPGAKPRLQEKDMVGLDQGWQESHHDEFTDQITLAAFQPTRSSAYGAFYYAWYKNPEIDSIWSYWQNNSHAPPDNWFSNYLPLPPGALDRSGSDIVPSIGLYSSGDIDVFFWQLTQMAEANLEFMISSWWGRSISSQSDRAGPDAVEGKSDYVFRQIVTDWMNLADNPYPNLRWTIYYEKEGYADPPVSEIVADLVYLNNHYVNEPSFLRSDERPVIFIYADAEDGCAMVNRWLQARAQTGINFYLVMKVFAGYEGCDRQPESWHQYAPAVRTGNYPPYSSFISPGFWKVGDPVSLARDWREFDSAAEAMVAANTHWKLVETWNEWGEGSAVEPGIQIIQSSTATAEADPNGAIFEDRYIDILSNRLPPLEAGTGALASVEPVERSLIHP